jgi:hypothetical protein
MSDHHEPKTTNLADHSPARTGRRRFIKAAGATAVAVPVMETLTGRDILTMSARAQTAGSQAFDGPMTGTLAAPV